MEPTTSLNDDVEIRLPPEFLSDDDYKLFKEEESNLFPYELIHGFGFDRSVKQTGEEESFLTRKIGQSSLEDNNHKVWGAARSSLCGAGDGYGCRSHNCQTRVSSQAAEWNLYCAALEKLNICDSYNSGRGVVAAAPVEKPNDGAGYYSRQSLQYHQKQLQALQFQQLKQQQVMMMQKSRGLKANNNKIATQSPSVWSNQPLRSGDGSGMRAVFLAGKRRSTGTGVFLPRRVNPETREKRSIATVLVPARVAEVLNLDESVVHPSVRSSASTLNGITEPSWRQKSYNGRFSSQMKMEQTVIEPRLPSDWAY